MTVARSVSGVLALLLFNLTGTVASADMTSDCERHAIAMSRKHGGDLRKIEIERKDFPIEDRYDDKVGSQPVSTELKGIVKLTTAAGMRQSRYICLHDGKKAVYFGWVD
ncbi:MAG: hypothetical protein K2P80_00455 [Beijerinckiaceae bacterium]|nr:hypothetical protein [Beijerinckiaceae bacterium]